MKLFGTDGIRGEYGKDFFSKDGRDVFLLGLAAAAVLGEKYKNPRIIIGRDTRQSSPLIESSLTTGLEEGGADVVSCGVFPTPGVAWIVRNKKFTSGVVISASHNPWRDNGIKFFSSGGEKFPDGLEKKIEEKWLRLSQQRKKSIPIRQNIERKKSVTRNIQMDTAPSFKSDYISYLVSTASSSVKKISGANFKVVVDCSNGSVSGFAGEVFKRLGIKFKLINASPDGKNINDRCGSLHPEVCASEVKKNSASLGISFDGDGDRVIFIDEKGGVIDGDKTIAVCARYLKGEGRLIGDCVVATVMSNLGFLKYMKGEGIKVFLSPVGDRNVWEEMKRRGAVLGGEQSGHIIFKDFATTGDGLLTAVQFLTAVFSDTSTKGKPLSVSAGSIFKKYPQTILNIPVESKIPLEKIPGFHDAVRREEKNMGDRGRIFVRYSGTEPILRIMVEGPDDKSINIVATRLKEVFLKTIKKNGIL